MLSVPFTTTVSIIFNEPSGGIPVFSEDLANASLHSLRSVLDLTQHNIEKVHASNFKAEYLSRVNTQVIVIPGGHVINQQGFFEKNSDASDAIRTFYTNKSDQGYRRGIEGICAGAMSVANFSYESKYFDFEKKEVSIRPRLGHTFTEDELNMSALKLSKSVCSLYPLDPEFNYLDPWGSRQEFEATDFLNHKLTTLNIAGPFFVRKKIDFGSYCDPKATAFPLLTTEAFGTEKVVAVAERHFFDDDDHNTLVMRGPHTEITQKLCDYEPSNPNSATEFNERIYSKIFGMHTKN